MEQALEPSHELRLGDPDLGVARNTRHRRRQRGKLVLQVGREHVGELAHRSLVDLPQPDPPGFIQGGGPRLLKELADHACDPEQLRRLRDSLARRRGLSGRNAIRGHALR